MNINDIDFNPTASEEVIERGKKWLVDNKERLKGTAAYCVMGEKEGVQSEHFRAACHAGIGYTLNFKPVIVATSNRWEKNPVTVPFKKEDVEFFLRWFLYDSPYGRFILNRDDFDFCMDHGFIVSADVYTPLMQNILIITRHFYEIDSSTFVAFRKYVEDGGHPHLAFNAFFCSYLSYRNGNTPSNSVVRSYGGHRAHNLFSLKALNNFITGEIGTQVCSKTVNDPTLYYSSGSNFYYTGGKLFFLDKGESSSPYQFNNRGQSEYPPCFINDMINGYEELREKLRKFRGEEGVNTYKPPNPFERPTAFASLSNHKPAPDEATYQELQEIILPFMKENKSWLKK